MLLAAPALVALAVSAPSGATVDAQPSTTHLRYPGQRGYAIGYVVQTGDQAETVTIHQTAPPWPDRRVAGSPVRMRSPMLRGPGTLGVATGVADYAFGTCLRGDTNGVPEQLRLQLGSHQRTTIVQPVGISAPPWPGARYVPRLTVAFASAPKAVPLPLANVRVTGRSGVHIRLHARPRLREDRFAGPSLPFGRPIGIVGSTQPAVAHARIRVTALALRDGGGLRRLALAVARTDAAGRFDLAPWLPPFAGTYRIGAAYRHPRADLVPDGNCDLRFTVRRR
jgi:hypothetical protein